MAHALAHTVLGFGVARFFLGLGEAGNFPAAIKTVAEWFPKKERAFATGLYNSGANIGAVVAPLSVPYIADAWGWEWAFILTGAVGLIWIIFWLKMYDSPQAKLKNGQLSQTEYDYIHGDKDEQIVENASAPKVSWGRLLAFRQTWSFVFGKFLTDPIWWFYMFWLPGFLNGENARKAEAFRAVNPSFTGLDADVPGHISWTVAVAVVYTIATGGSILGGWLPKKFINGGMDANKSRKNAMFIFAHFPLTVLFASRLGEIDTWLAVGAIAIACSAHQAWSANIFTTVSDMFPKNAVASVTGIGGMSGAIGGIFIAWAAGLLLKHFTELHKVEAGYAILFVVCGSSYLVAWVVMHLLAPKFQKVKL
jgi:ACS family hexuronate transporter-like MFS transporter